MVPQPWRHNAQFQPRTVALKNICHEYPAGGGILRELLQNADDAGASIVKFILDPSTHPTEPLLDPQLAQYQGPALLAFNNAIFAEQDLVSLSRIGDSCKAQDGSTTGRFGRGFNSVYNWTDSPSIVSRDFLLILDPHEQWSKGGPVYNFVKEVQAIEMENQMAAFSMVTKDFDCSFEGTIIRIPLRTSAQAKTSQICNRETTVSQVEDVMQMFVSDFGPTGLLFMKNVEKISIAVGNATLAEVRVSNCIDVRRDKSLVNQMVKRMLAEAVKTFNLSFEVEIEHEQNNSKRQTRFAVHHRIEGYIEDEELKNWTKAQSLIPWVAVATQLQINSVEAAQGSLFTVLPLQIRINQPIHIHGLFSLSPDRARLHLNNDNTAQNQLPWRWNEWLFDIAIPTAWIEILLYLAKQYPKESAFEKWPHRLESPKDLGYNINKRVVELIENNAYQLWYTDLGYIKSEVGLLAHGNETPDQRRAFHDAGVPVIYLTDELRSSVEGICKADHLSPQRLSDRLGHAGKQVEGLNEHTKQVLLDYVISDRKFCGYGAIELFPFEDGIYRSIDQVNAFIHRDEKDRDLFSLEHHENIDLGKLSPNTLQTIQNGCTASYLHKSLRHRFIYDLEPYCKRTIFELVDYGQDAVHLDRDVRAFIPKVWDWIAARGRTILDDNVSSLWLIPLTNNRYRKIKPVSSSSDTIYAPPGEMGDFLRKLAAIPMVANKPILLTDCLPSRSLQLLTDSLKNFPSLHIKIGDVLEDFVLWLNSIREVVGTIPNEDKMRLQELIVSRIPLCTNVSVVSNALRELEVFQEVVWKDVDGTMELCSSWVTLSRDCRTVGLQDTIPVPKVPKTRFLDARSEGTSKLLKKFGLADCLSTLDVLKEFIIPSWEGKAFDSWTTSGKERIAELLARQFHSLGKEHQKRISLLPFVPVRCMKGATVAKFDTASRLIDPSIQQLRDLYFEDEENCPVGWATEKYRGVLIECGLKISLDEDLVEDRVRSFAVSSRPVEAVRTRAANLLRCRLSWTSPSGGYRRLSSRSLQWLPATDQDGNSVQSSSENCRGLGDKLLVGLVLPILNFETSEEWRHYLGWNDPVPDAILLAQLKQGIQQENRKIVDTVLTYVKQKGKIESMFEALVNLGCVLTSSGRFVASCKTFHTGCENLQPYFHNVDSGFWQDHNILLAKLAIKNKPALEDLLRIQEMMECRVPLNEADTEVTIEVIKLAAKFPRKSLSALKIIGEDGRLYAIEEMTYPDLGPSTITGQFQSTHSSLPLNVIRKIQIEPLSERVKKGELGLEDIDDEDEFDQREDVATSIAGTLDRYPVETTFKEYLANADDTETASEVNWLLDKRVHPKQSLMTKELSGLQGPALLVHNDAIFLEKDFKGLKNVGRGSKRDDPSTIGKFGRGSQTMYHWTDVPMVLSGNRLVILDPLQEVLQMNYRKNHRKSGVIIELSKLRARYPDQLSPFEGLWGYSRELDYYPGTIFRFPLRPPTVESRLRETNTPLYCDSVRHHMEKFFNEARICLLFLKHIRSVDFKIHGETQYRWSVKSSREGPDDTFSGWTICSLTKSLGSEPIAKAKDRWWVANHDPSEFPSELLHRHKRTMKNVECGMAALESSTPSNEFIISDATPEPRFFSSLPLSFASNLPVHIHATFQISGDRQSIPVEESMRDSGSDWNRWLLTSAVPSLYLAFLEDLGREIGQKIFSFWPAKTPSKGSLAELVHSSFWQQIQLPKNSSCRLFPLARRLSSPRTRRPPKLMELKEAIFDFLPNADSGILAALLETLVPSLVYVPLTIKEQLEFSQIQVTSVTGALLRTLFRSEEASNSLEKAASKDPRVFEAIFKALMPSTDREFEELDGCRILPLVDGSLGTLRISDSTSPSDYYYVATDREVKLFDFASALLTTLKVGKQLKQALSVRKRFNLVRLRPTHISVLLDRKVFPTGDATDEMDPWLHEFWAFWHKEETSLDGFDKSITLIPGISGHPIFQATCNGVKTYISPKELDILPSIIESNVQDQRGLCDKLPGIYRFNRDFIPISLRMEEDSFIDPASFTRLIKSLSKLSARAGLEFIEYIRNHLGVAELQTLRRLVVHYMSMNFSSGWVEIQGQLMSLPLWPAVAPPSSLIPAREALIVTDSRLKLPWMAKYTQFLETGISPSHEAVLVRLGAKVLDNSTLLANYILPYLPQNLSTSDKAGYQSLIAAISDKSAKERKKNRQRDFQDVLRQKRLAADRTGVLRLASQLFDEQDEIFASAFRNETETRFLLQEVQKYRGFWLGIGLSYRVDGHLSSKDYILCLQTMRRRLEAPVALPSDPYLIPDAEKVLKPLITSSIALAHFDRTSWSSVAREAIFPALTALDTQSEYRRETMQMLAIATPLLSLADIVQSKHIPVCWSQSSFPMYQPTSTTFDNLPTKGKPPMEMVWRHLKHMKSSFETLTPEAVTSFLSDLYCTYDFLQTHLKESTATFNLHAIPIWLNLDSTNPKSITLNHLHSSWSSIEHLILSSSFDSPPLMSVRQTLMPYERLLRELGCQSINYPLYSPPKRSTPQSISSSLDRLRQEEKMLDVTFSAEGKEVRAHKVVLAAASAYCETSFNGNWPTHGPISVEISHLTLKSMIDFAYTDDCDWGSMQVVDADEDEEIADKLDKLLDLLAGADSWFMPALVIEVESQIQRADRKFIRVENVLEIQKRAADANAHHLEQWCKDFYRHNQGTVDLVYRDRGNCPL